MDYSIVIPVFNKAALTRQCLRTLRATLEGAGEGEILVIDNASSDGTPAMLEEFPWVRTIRNEKNRGFAGANNQGAHLAHGRFLVLLNNDTEAKPGWLAAMLASASDPGVGAVGARLLFANGTIQHAGVVNYASRFGTAGFVPVHDMYQYPADYPPALQSRDLQMVTGACMLTPRELYLELGGLDEAYWNGYEDIDYCFKVRERGLRVVYRADAVLTHYESQSGTQRFRKVAWNTALLAARWNARVAYDGNRRLMERGYNRRDVRSANAGYSTESVASPAATILCHGPLDRARDAQYVRTLRANVTPVARIFYVGEGAKAIDAACREMEVRGDRYLAFVDSRCELREGWLDDLIEEVEFGWNVGAAAYAPETGESGSGALYCADARCTLLSLRKYPQHHRLEPAPTLGESLADFLIRGIDLYRGSRRVTTARAQLPPPEPGVADVVRSDVDFIERRIRSAAGRRRGLVSIVMLSWNAPEFTKSALASIRSFTKQPYEVIIVDNGSGEETVNWLQTLEDVHVIYNPVNRGYAAGNNQALAAAKGEYVVLLNNDVIVTEDWLDGLLGAFDRVPGVGISAPRSNQIAGDQIVIDAQYAGEDGLQEFARKRAERYRGQGYLSLRAIGLCLCIDRRVIEEIGGLDERFGLGNFEDDDYSIRARAAGYKIYVCDDVFIHHFGSRSFAANKVDYTATMHANWSKFASKWGFAAEYPTNGYDLRAPVALGFNREAHYVPLPRSEPPDSLPGDREYALVIAAVVRSEREWNEIGPFVRRYLAAYRLHDQTLLTIAASGDLTATVLGQRVERTVKKMDLSPDEIPDLAISDESALDEWVASLRGRAMYRLNRCGVAQYDALPELRERSPSALRRLA